MPPRGFLNLPDGLKMPCNGLTWMAKSEKELEDSLNTGLEVGYRHFDTTFAYQHEGMIGKILKKWFDSGKVKREEIFITTRLPTFSVHPHKVEFFLEKSLKNLQLDYVDLYLIELPTCFTFEENSTETVSKRLCAFNAEVKGDHIGIWKKMEDQVDAGRTKTIGLANFNITQIRSILKQARIQPASLQVEVHVFLQHPDLVDFCHEHGINVVAYSPIGTAAYNSVMIQLGLTPREIPNILTNSVVKAIAKKHGKTPAQISMRYLLQLGFATIPEGVHHPKDNIVVFDFQLDEEDLNALKRMDQNYRIYAFNDFLPA